MRPRRAELVLVLLTAGVLVGIGTLEGQVATMQDVSPTLFVDRLSNAAPELHDGIVSAYVRRVPARERPEIAADLAQELATAGPELRGQLLRTIERLELRDGRAPPELHAPLWRLVNDVTQRRDLRLRAMSILIQCGFTLDTDLPTLRALVEAPGELTDLRRRAVMAIGVAREPDHLTLREYLRGDDVLVGYWACLALADLGREARPATGALIRYLERCPPGRIHGPAEALGAIGPDARAVTPFLLDFVLRRMDEGAVETEVLDALLAIGVDPGDMTPQRLERARTSGPVNDVMVRLLRDALEREAEARRDSTEGGIR